ncbi:MAG: O-antigen ligase family protein [Thermoleophilia bacterium]|nr:O-antigen ligase family protein [Thermoleophilia bacterium]
MDRRTTILLAAAAGAVFMTAFEVLRPVFSLGSIGFTTSQLAAILFIAAFALWAGKSRAGLRGRGALDAAVVLFVASNFLSAAFAADTPGALKFSLRMTLAALVYFGISRLPARAPSHQVVAGSAAAALLVVSLVGLLEYFVSFADWARLLSPWQEDSFVFGAFYNIRISSTLPYPTSLAMFIELTLPLLTASGLWLIALKPASDTRRRLLMAALAAAMAAAVAVLIFTYTRSSLAALPLSMITGAAAALVYGYGKRTAAFFLLAAALMVSILGVSTIFSDRTAARLGVAEPAQRFSAEYQILEFPADLRPGEESRTRLKISNTSDVTWIPAGEGRVLASYRWFENGRQTGETSVDSSLPRDIRPGEEFELEVRLLAPREPGSYVVAIELLQAGVGWFSDTHVRPAMVAVEIDWEGSRTLPLSEEETRFIWSVDETSTAPRAALWRAAARMWADHFLLGVGPGQFRTAHAEYLSGYDPDERLEAHNIILSAAANTGLIGVAAMLYLLAGAAWAQLRMVRDRALAPDRRLLALGLLAALVAYVSHGMLDYFLWQTGIALMFFAQLGLTSWLYYDRNSGT